ncbi:MAG: O-antigen ligase protein [Paenibacillaceae bacterium]|jgi:O-antigen ligase/tetratricopeptide (TPR) repeat protein|nr:O-antigen ligase protein [Paenibacillaceae bacterium]
MKTKAKTILPVNVEHKSIIFWLILSTVVFLLFFAAYETALFNGYSPHYDKPIFSTLLASSMTLILLAVYLFFNWKLNDTRDLLNMYIWLVPLSYLISRFAAASPDLAGTMTTIHVMYASLFMVGAYMSRNELGARLLQIAITILGYSVVLYGLACAFGNMYFRDAVMLTVDGYRLTSVFQYANAYAAFLIAVMLCSLYYIMHSKKWYMIFVNSLMLVPILVSFWLTLSRGGIVTLPFIFLAILPLLSITKQVALSAYVMIGTAASFLLTSFVTEKSIRIVTEVLKRTSPDLKTAETYSWFNGESLSGWGGVFGVSLIAAGIIVALQYFVASKLELRLVRFSSRKLSRLLIPAGLVIIGTLGVMLLLGTPVKALLPEALETRLENINFQQHSVLERGTFYKDSLKVFKEHPVIGAGGGGWAVLYEKYQNNPYVSRQAHNFFLQYAIEVGSVGLIIFLGLLVAVYWLFIRKSFAGGKEEVNSHLIFYFVSISILIHSILDFEMSYVFLGSLVFFCLGGLTSVLDGKPTWMGKLSFLTARRFIYPTVVSVLAVVFFVVSIINVTDENSYNKAIAYANQGKPFNQVLAPLDAAIQSSSRPDHYALKVDFLLQVYSQTKQEDYWNQAKTVIEEAREKEPNNRLLLERQYALYIIKQQLDQAITVVQEGLSKYPWELSFYERNASLHNAKWNQAKQENNSQFMEQNWQALLENYQTIQQGIDHIATLPEGQLQGRPFYHSAIIRYSVGQIYMINGENDKALAELQPAGAEANGKLAEVLQPDQKEQYKQIVRWYLALTQKVGKLDQAMYDSFTSAYPEEKEQINLIAALK